MEALAQRFGVEHIDAWFIAGVLHDIDYEHCGTETMLTDHAVIGAEWLEKKGIHASIVEAVRVHNPHNKTGEPQTLLARALRSCEQITGLISACVAVRPDKDIRGLEVRSVKKKLKDKSFARGVERQWIQSIPDWLPETAVDDVLQLTIETMVAHADELGYK